MPNSVMSHSFPIELTANVPSHKEIERGSSVPMALPHMLFG
jgi:hypothetical protein